MEAGVCEMDAGVKFLRRGRYVGQRGEQSQEILIDIHAQGTKGEHVAAEMEFAVLALRQQKRRMDVLLSDEVAKLRRDDAVGWNVLARAGFQFRVRVRFPFLEDGSELSFAAEQSNSLPAVAHAWFQNPPFLVDPCRVAGEALVQLVGFEQGFVEELGIVEFEV